MAERAQSAPLPVLILLRPLQVASCSLANPPIPLQSGKNGANGPNATPLASVAENFATEPAQLPCSEATTALATKLRRLPALRLDAAQALCRASEPWTLLINHLVKTPPVQVGFDP